MALSREVVAYPLNRRLLIPTSTGRGAAAAIATSMSCKPAAVGAHHLAWLVTRCSGTAMIPGARQALRLPEAVDAVLSDVAEVVGGIDSVAVLSRRQARRGAHLVLAYQASTPIAFCKIADSSNAPTFDTEQRCLRALSLLSPGPVVVPQLLAAGLAHGLQYTAMSALPPRPHRPARGDISAVVAWIQRGLANAIPRTGPAHWRAIHGDFAPWNLRRLWFGDRTLFDFEDARYGPPLADTVFWNVATATLRGRAMESTIDEESREFWRLFLEDRLSTQSKPELDDRLLATLLNASVS